LDIIICIGDVRKKRKKKEKEKEKGKT